MRAAAVPSRWVHRLEPDRGDDTVRVAQLGRAVALRGLAQPQAGAPERQQRGGVDAVDADLDPLQRRRGRPGAVLGRQRPDPVRELDVELGDPAADVRPQGQVEARPVQLEVGVVVQLLGDLGDGGDQRDPRRGGRCGVAGPRRPVEAVPVRQVDELPVDLRVVQRRLMGSACSPASGPATQDRLPCQGGRVGSGRRVEVPEPPRPSWGAAILDDLDAPPALLAARRTAPPRLAGGVGAAGRQGRAGRGPGGRAAPGAPGGARRRVGSGPRSRPGRSARLAAAAGGFAAGLARGRRRRGAATAGGPRQGALARPGEWTDVAWLPADLPVVRRLAAEGT